jgi:hypothetical protein
VAKSDLVLAAEWHPLASFIVQLLVAAGTLALAGVTALLAFKTRGMEQAAKDALEVGVRPLLADPNPTHSSSGRLESLLFGAPGRISLDVPHGELWYDFNKDESLAHFSVAFENVGSGVAGILGARVLPQNPGDVYVSRKVVPVGALLRVNVSVLHAGFNDTERFKTRRWAFEHVFVEVTYASTYGGDQFTATAEIAQYETQAPFVQSISVKRLKDGAVIVAGRGLY